MGVKLFGAALAAGFALAVVAAPVSFDPAAGFDTAAAWAKKDKEKNAKAKGAMAEEVKSMKECSKDDISCNDMNQHRASEKKEKEMKMKKKGKKSE